MRSVKKCLLTARDPASANDLGELLPSLLKLKRLEVCILAQDPAFKFFKYLLNGSEILAITELHRVNSRDHLEIEQQVTSLINRFQPDFLISGISGPDYGVDEIALKIV